MADDHEAQLELELNVLRAVPGVRCVSASKYTGRDLNKMNVFLLITPPAAGSSEMPVRTNCSRQLPNKIAAAREAQRKVELIVGDTVMRAAEQRAAAAALEASSSAASEAAAAPAPVVERTVAAVLGATQQLQGALRAAELRAEQAWTRVLEAEAAHENAAEQTAEARDALSAHQKRQRSEAEQVQLPEPP